MGVWGSFLNFGEKQPAGISGTWNFIADRLQAQRGRWESVKSDWSTSGTMRRCLAAVRLTGGSSESDGSGSPTWEDEESDSSWLSRGNSRGSGSRTVGIDREFPRCGRVEHGDMTKFQVLGEGVRNGKRVCVPRNVEILGESCFVWSKLEFVTFESESKLTRIEKSCFSEC
jgi:hypothetical protein